MRQLQDDVIDNTLFSIEDIPSTAGQADAVFASPVSGINDSTYNSFPATPSYMQGGFAPSTPVYEEPISVIAEPIYTPPQQPIYTAPTPIDTPRLGKCMRVIFSANRGFSAHAYWTDCSGVQRGQFVSVNESLEVDALDGTASGLPFMSYPIGHSPIPPAYEPVPPMEQPQPYKPPYQPVPVPQEPIQEYPVDPIFLLPINPNLPLVPIREEPIQEPIQTPAPAPTPVVEPTPVDAIKTGVMPPSDMEQMPLRPAVEPTSPVVQTITPETPSSTSTLPTKAVSKDLKPYILAGVGIVAILIAARLLSKK